MHSRPLRELTEVELDVLDTLGGPAGLFNNHLASGLTSLGALAGFEINEREYQAAREREGK